jgi:hypothetical protein
VAWGFFRHLCFCACVVSVGRLSQRVCMYMTGTRTASVTAYCARCVPNAPLLVGVIHCEAKIALSNSLAALGVFSLAYNRGKYGAFMHLFLSLFCPPELHCFAYLIFIVPPCAARRTCNRTATCCPLFCAVLLLYIPHLKVSM